MSRKRRTIEDVDSEEAEEVHGQLQELDQAPIDHSDQEGDDLEGMAPEDYKIMPELDNYEADGIDDAQIIEQNQQPGARFRAEREMDRREEHAQLIGIEDYMDDQLSEGQISQSRRQAFYLEQEQEQVDERRYVDVQEVKGKLPQWIKEQETIKYIKSKFTKFLNHFKGESNFPIYGSKIKEMCVNNRQSLDLSYVHLKQALPTIAMWVGLQPALILPQLNAIAYSFACRNYASYKTMFPQVYIKIKDLPIMDYIRDLRHIHLGKLIKVKGVVTVRSQVFSQLKKIIYKCTKCGFPKGPFYINSINNIKLGNCASCQSPGPYLIDKQKTIYRNYQKLTLQQAPSEVLPGRIPRTKEVILFGDNIDIARPGDYVEVTGIYMNRYECSLNVKHGFPLFSTLIEANSINKALDSDAIQVDSLTQDKILEFAKNHKNLDEMIYDSISPSIYGHNQIKRALALAMFGGVQRQVEGTHRIRGEINVLLLGDPGIAKSQFLKSVQKVFYRSIYTTGKGASAVGLTASVRRDHSTGEWKLQAGALVLADKGICLIDQFDKMNEHDRTSIHEAMEQQSISISKAGIVTTLRARCSVIAAANPLQGRYNSQLNFTQNVDLSDPILSRFDIINVVRDEVDIEIDTALSTFVINQHMRNHPYRQIYSFDQCPTLPQGKNQQPPIDPQFLRSYIRYAREKCKPQFSSKHIDMVKDFYKKLREASKETGGLNIAVRHIESILRVAVAHAKMYLRSEVAKQDLNVGIKCILESFIQTQKHSVAKNIRRKFGYYLQ